MEFLEKFNEITQEHYNYLRVHSVDIKKNPPTITINFLAPYDIIDRIMTDQDRTNIMKAVEMIIPNSMNIAVNYVKSFVNEEVVKMLVMEYFTKKHPTIIVEAKDVKVSIADEVVNITISMKSLFYDFFMSHDIANTMAEYMSHKFCNAIHLELIDSKQDLDIDSDFAADESITIVSRKVRTSDHTIIHGKSIQSRARYIVDCPEQEEKATYCGEVVDFKRKASKKTGNSYYEISINDGTGILLCKAFTKYSGEGEYDKINIGDEIIVYGNVEQDTYAHCTALLVRDMNKCVIDKTSIILKEDLKKEPATYTYVLPTKYEQDMVVKNDLFTDGGDVVVCPESMLGKSYVVFDFETTGIDTSTCEPIELGAVKVVDGIITEAFSTFVKPSCPIPEEITNITSITDEDVKNAPTMEQVIPDFYKFSRGSILVGHNVIQYDKPILDRYAKQYRYLFDNRVVDTLLVARKTLTSKNYKLITICEYLGISLEGAHRAVNDCEATAKALIEMAKLGGLGGK